jgi:hypothetical protein
VKRRIAIDAAFAVGLAYVLWKAQRRLHPCPKPTPNFPFEGGPVPQTWTEDWLDPAMDVYDAVGI